MSGRESPPLKKGYVHKQTYTSTNLPFFSESEKLVPVCTSMKLSFAFSDIKDLFCITSPALSLLAMG